MALSPALTGRRDLAAPKPISFSPHAENAFTSRRGQGDRPRQSHPTSRTTDSRSLSRVSPPQDAQSTSSSTLVNQDGPEMASRLSSTTRSQHYLQDDEWSDEAGLGESSSSDTLKRMLRHRRAQGQTSPRQQHKGRWEATPSQALDVSPLSSPRPELRLGCPEGCLCTEQEIELGLCRCASSATTTASSSEESSIPSSVALGKRKDVGGAPRNSETARWQQRTPVHRRQQPSDASIRTMTPGGASSASAASLTSSPRKSEASTARGSLSGGRRDLEADPVLVPRWAATRAAESSDDASLPPVASPAARPRGSVERRLASSPGPRPSPRASWSRPRTRSPDGLERSSLPSLYAQGRREEAHRSADSAPAGSSTPASALTAGAKQSKPSSSAPRSATRRSIENVFERVRKQMEREKEAIEEQRRARQSSPAALRRGIEPPASREGDSLGEDTLLHLRAEREHDERRLERIRSRASGASSASSGSVGRGRGGAAAQEAPAAESSRDSFDAEDAQRETEAAAPGFDSLDLPPLPVSGHLSRSSIASRPPRLSWTASTPHESPAKPQQLTGSPDPGRTSASRLTIPTSPAPASAAATTSSPMSWAFPGASPLHSPSLSSPGGSSSPRRGSHRRGGPGASGAEALVATRVGEGVDGRLSPALPSPRSPQVLSISRRFPPGDAERAMRALQDALGAPPAREEASSPQPAQDSEDKERGDEDGSLSLSASDASRLRRARQVRFSPRPDYRSASSHEEDDEDEEEGGQEGGDDAGDVSLIVEEEEEPDDADAAAEAEETQDSLAELGSQTHTGFAPHLSPVKAMNVTPSRRLLASPSTPRLPGGFASPARPQSWPGLAPSAPISTPLQERVNHAGSSSHATPGARQRTTSPPPAGLTIPRLPALTRSSELLRNQRGSPKPPGSFGTPLRAAGHARGVRSASSTPSLIRWSEIADVSNSGALASVSLGSVAEDEVADGGAQEHAGDASTVQSTPDISISSSAGSEDLLPRQSTPPRKGRASSSFLSGASANGSFVDERGREVPAIGTQEEEEETEESGPEDGATGGPAEDDSIMITLRQLRETSQARDVVSPTLKGVNASEAGGEMAVTSSAPPAAPHKERARALVPLIKDARSRITSAASSLRLSPHSLAAETRPRRTPLAVAALVTLQLSLAWLLFCSAQARLDDLYAETLLDPFFPALYAPDIADGRWASMSLLGASDFGPSSSLARRLALWLYDVLAAPTPALTYDSKVTVAAPSAWEPWRLLLSALLRPLRPMLARLPLDVGAMLLDSFGRSSGASPSPLALIAYEVGHRVAT